MPDTFTITTATNSVKPDANRRANVTFTVFNASNRSVRGRARIVASNPTVAAWLALEGDAERDFGIATAQQFAVSIIVPPTAPAGNYGLQLSVVAVDNPDEDFSLSPNIAFEVAPPTPERRGFPWWIPVVAGVVALLLIGGIIAIVVSSTSSASNAQTVTAQAIASSLNGTATAIGGQTAAALDTARAQAVNAQTIAALNTEIARKTAQANDNATSVAGTVNAVITQGVSGTITANFKQQERIVNGNFMNCVDPNTTPSGFIIFPVGQFCPGWTVTRGSIDIVGTKLWDVPGNTRSIDLNGNEPGGIAQTFDSIPGAEYIVSFDLAANPGLAVNPIRTVLVRFGTLTQQFQFNVTGKSARDMGYARQTAIFKAAAAKTTLSFDSLDPNSGTGPVIANISVTIK